MSAVYRLMPRPPARVDSRKTNFSLPSCGDRETEKGGCSQSVFLHQEPCGKSREPTAQGCLPWVDRRRSGDRGQPGS